MESPRQTIARCEIDPELMMYYFDQFAQFLIRGDSRWTRWAPIWLFNKLSRLNWRMYSAVYAHISHLRMIWHKYASSFVDRAILRRYPQNTRTRIWSRRLWHLETDERTLLIPGTKMSAADAAALEATKDAMKLREGAGLDIFTKYIPEPYMRLVSMTFLCTRPVVFNLYIFGATASGAPIHKRVSKFSKRPHGCDMVMGDPMPFITSPTLDPRLATHEVHNVFTCTGMYVAHVTFDRVHCVRHMPCMSFLVSRYDPLHRTDASYLVMDAEFSTQIITHIIVSLKLSRGASHLGSIC